MRVSCVSNDQHPASVRRTGCSPTGTVARFSGAGGIRASKKGSFFIYLSVQARYDWAGTMQHRLYEVIIGNVIGVVEEPETNDCSRPAGEQYMVKIGSVNNRLPLEKQDCKEVIERLKAFVTVNVLPVDWESIAGGITRRAQ
jgi:hypothetical protein